MARRTKKTTGPDTSSDDDVTPTAVDRDDPNAVVEDAEIVSDRSQDGTLGDDGVTVPASEPDREDELEDDRVFGKETVWSEPVKVAPADEPAGPPFDERPAGGETSAKDRPAEATDALVVATEGLRGNGDETTTLDAGDRTIDGEVRSADHDAAVRDGSDPIGSSADDQSHGDRDLPPMVAPPPQVIEKRGPGFVPLVFGGLLAGAIGYAIPTVLAPAEDGSARVDALEADIVALRDAAPAGSGADFAPLQVAQTDLMDRVAALEAEMAGLPATPAPAGPATAASTADVADAPDLAGLQSELAAVSGSVETLSSEVTALAGRVDAFDPDAASAVSARVDTLSAQTDEIGAAVTELQSRAESNADDAEAVAREAARNQLVLAMESGLPYADALAQLPDTPDALAASAETGVATAADLATDFPPLSRAALREARAAEPGEVGLGSLAGRFLNARSLEPREGDDPDAVLSRAEAAMRAGDVAAALAEIEALPDLARAPLADWVARAEARATAEAALNEYLQDG